MAATLKLTHKAIGVEVRRGTYDIVVDGQRAGSLEMNDTIEMPVEPRRHTLQVRTPTLIECVSQLQHAHSWEQESD